MIKGILDIENSLAFHEKKLKSKMMKYNIQRKKVYELETNEHNDNKKILYNNIFILV